MGHRNYVMKELEDIFDSLDNDNKGCIVLDEFLRWTDNARSRAFFERVLGVDVYKAEQSFKLLDIDDTQSLEREEFVAGCIRLAGRMTNMENQMNVRFMKRM